MATIFANALGSTDTPSVVFMWRMESFATATRYAVGSDLLQFSTGADHFGGFLRRPLVKERQIWTMS